MTAGKLHQLVFQVDIILCVYDNLFSRLLFFVIVGYLFYFKKCEITLGIAGKTMGMEVQHDHP